MTEKLKQKLEKRFEKWLRKYLLCNDCKRKCTCIQLNAYCEEQVKQAYIAGATEATKELEKENAEAKEIIREYKNICNNTPFLTEEEMELKEKAEAFLKE